MKKLFVTSWFIFLFLNNIKSQQLQRIPIIAAADTAYPQWNYQSYLSDSLQSLVPSVWGISYHYSTVLLTLQKKAILNKISLYDYTGVCTNEPAYIYVLNEKDTLFVGTFIGTKYMTYVDIDIAIPFAATKIAIKKFGNNIPQKVLAFGTDYFSNTICDSFPSRLTVNAITESTNTNSDYSNWLTDSLNNLVLGNFLTTNQQYVDVKLTLNNRAQISKILLFDDAGTFDTNPAYIFTQKDTVITFVGIFNGDKYKQFVQYIIPESQQADAVIIRKFANNIPQKVQIFGKVILQNPFYTPTALPIVAQDSLIELKSIKPSINTGMKYTPWLQSSLDSLVKSVWNITNNQWVDVTIKLPGYYNISKVELYDHQGVFTNQPASIFYKKDSTLTLIGIFDGAAYKVIKPYLLPLNPIANAIVVRKYANNIPQKIRVYGKWIAAYIDNDTLTNTTPIINTNADTAQYTKIPIEAKRWYILNYAPKGIGALFNGITTEPIATGFSLFNKRYDCIYPINKGENIAIHQIKMYDGAGIFAREPMYVYGIKNNGTKVLMATFTGSVYNQWVGPYPYKQNNINHFTLDTAITDIQYIVINCFQNDLPTEVEFLGQYIFNDSTTAGNNLVMSNIGNAVGINGFEWDFVNPTINSRLIDEKKYAAIKNFTGFRHYLDWYRLEDFEGKYTFNPCHWGGWDYDMTYERCKRDSIEVLVCIKNMPRWMKETYPLAERADDNVPVKYGQDINVPASYIELGRVAFQFTARYGRNTQVPLSLLKINTTPRWPGDPANTTKVGLNYIKYIECGNELDKWWRGLSGYMNPYQMAAMLSTFYDGHKGTLGNNVGIKTADSTMQVVIGGLAFNNPSYVRGMLEWCRQNRGYKSNGDVDICWDIINYHHFSNNALTTSNGISTRGAAPEITDAETIAKEFLFFSKKFLNDMPIWITELGYDLNQASSLKAIPIGTKSAMETQADWILRSALFYMSEGINRLFFYEIKDFNSESDVKFASMGLVDTNFKRRPALDYLYQTNQLMGKYTFVKKLQQLPIIDEYALGAKKMYAAWVPNENGTQLPFTLTLLNTDSAIIYTPTVGANNMHATTIPVINNQVTLMATETPIFIEKKLTVASKLIKKNSTVVVKNTLLKPIINVYPNPFIDKINFSITMPFKGKVDIEIFTLSGQLISQYLNNIVEKNQPTLFTIPLNMVEKQNFVYRCTINEHTFFGQLQSAQ